MLSFVLLLLFHLLFFLVFGLASFWRLLFVVVVVFFPRLFVSFGKPSEIA